jgi:hypothetical protein
MISFKSKNYSQNSLIENLGSSIEHDDLQRLLKQMLEFKQILERNREEQDQKQKQEYQCEQLKN